MAATYSEYLIVGGGLAGVSAIEGIRELDQQRSITLIGSEAHLPYDRPPLSKKLWFGKKKVEDIFLHDQAFYDRNGVTAIVGRRITALDLKNKTVADDHGETRMFGKLLLATGGTPQRLTVPGADADGVCYYRFLDDYLRISREAEAGKSVIIVGGGFIGSEMAAALCARKLAVTMLYPSAHLCDRVFPSGLGLAMEGLYQDRGIRIVKGQKPVSIERSESRLAVRTSAGNRLEADLVIAGVGIRPEVELAEKAGLATDNGIIVDGHLQSSQPDVYAAGDNARFPYRGPAGPRVRLEHWDNALSQGKQAGRNMAGAAEMFTYMPYFFSDLFEFGYEAVGDVDSGLEVFADWQRENEKGIIYYMRDGAVVGAMMCNVWNKVPAARELIMKGERRNPSDLKGAIVWKP